MKVGKKTILVTGGGNGMGREIVLNLLSRGSNVIAVDINELALQHTASLVKENWERLTTFTADITNVKSVEQLLEKSLMAYGKIDGLINNAGIVQPFQKLNDIPFDTIDRVFDVNFNGTLYMTASFAFKTGGSYCKHFQYGRIFACSGTDDLRSIKSSRQDIDRRFAIRTFEDSCESYRRFSGSIANKY